MNERPAILIVDSNIGFAMMLKESLEQENNYRAAVVHTGDEALATASQESFDLAIVDLGLEAIGELDGEAVARKLRGEQPHLRLMLIPLEGETLPEELTDLDAQGVLPKPFFLPDLPDLLDSALTKPLRTVEEVEDPEERPEPTKERMELSVAAGPTEPAPESSPRVIRELEILVRELNADAVLVTRGDAVLGSVGRLSDEATNTLADIIARSQRLSSQAAQILGREQRRFEQNVESGEHMLYSVTIFADVLLSASLRPGVTLGLLRHEMKAAAKRLQDAMAESG